jgi:hypothetical protein
LGRIRGGAVGGFWGRTPLRHAVRIALRTGYPPPSLESLRLSERAARELYRALGTLTT